MILDLAGQILGISFPHLYRGKTLCRFQSCSGVEMRESLCILLVLALVSSCVYTVSGIHVDKNIHCGCYLNVPINSPAMWLAHDAWPDQPLRLWVFQKNVNCQAPQRGCNELRWLSWWAQEPGLAPRCLDPDTTLGVEYSKQGGLFFAALKCLILL